MKFINKFRNTKKFCLINSDCQNIAKIVARFGNDLTAIAKTPKEDLLELDAEEGRFYTVRVSDEEDGIYRIKDHIVCVTWLEDAVVIRKTKIIMEFNV